MRMSRNFFITRREYPKDEEVISTKLLVKSGMILKNETGVYSYLPLGLKVIENIKNIIRKEMNANGADEVLMPSLVSSDVFEFTGRRELFDGEIFDVNSRSNKMYSLCPTHEELFSFLARSKVRSYKDLHFTLYQISNKYRDEMKVEHGLIRKKEFFMADAYSFDANDGGLDISYDKMFLTFKNIFAKMHLDPIVVSSDDNTMKGLSSEEFQIVCDYGDNKVVRCTNCTFSCNIDEAKVKVEKHTYNGEIKEKRLIKTPNIKSIKALSEFLGVDASNIIKSLVVKIDEKYVMVLLKGFDELNIEKLCRVLKRNDIVIPDEYELEKIGTKAGYIGPIGCTMDIIADNEIKNMYNVICGSNKEDYHYENVNPGIDFKVSKYADLKMFNVEDCVCPKCKSKCEVVKGIEVGHIFKLGQNYSELYDLKYVDEANELDYVHMGSYGIGIERCLSSIVEMNHDDKGIIWPMSVAPYKVAIVIVNVNDQETYKYALNLYNKLNTLGIDTILDDRKESVGVKFNDMDLLGIPIRVTVGSKYESGFVEFKLRNEANTKFIKVDNLIEKIQRAIEKQ